MHIHVPVTVRGHVSWMPMTCPKHSADIPEEFRPSGLGMEEQHMGPFSQRFGGPQEGPSLDGLKGLQTMTKRAMLGFGKDPACGLL